MIKNKTEKTRFLSPVSEILSGAPDAGAVRIPPDMGLCEDCLRELYEEADPRFQHPFISCAHCGPRFSIIDQDRIEQNLSTPESEKTGRSDNVLTYERSRTTMADFPMCGFCDVQYTDKEDRRYHAPALSCHACGPKLKWQEQAPQIPETDAADGAAPNPDEDTNAALQMILSRSAHLRTAPDESPVTRHTSADDRRILDAAAQILADGGVIAFKTFSGCYLAADPFNAEAAARLEKILRNADAPDADASGAFAAPVLFRDLHEIRYYLQADETAEHLLSSSARPIVLLEHRLNDPGFSKAANRRFPVTEDGTPEPSFEYLRRSRTVAAVLPSMAAQYLLLDRISPLFFVDAAKAGLSSFASDEEMLAWFTQQPEIGGILYHDVPIRASLPDSMMQITEGQPQMLLRARGFVPLPVIAAVPETADAGDDPAPVKVPAIFAAGTGENSSFVLSDGTAFYPSQPLGDLNSAAAQRTYQDTVTRMENLLDIHPELIVCDMDPMSETTRFAKTYAMEHSLPLLQVQRDHARIASVMAEHDLTGPVIGISFGDPGHGTDDALWGGDILLCEGAGCRRLSHLKYDAVTAGDALPDERGCPQFAIDISDILEFAESKGSAAGAVTADGTDAAGGLTADGPDAAGADQKATSRSAVPTSSMRRFIDAVSELLGLEGSFENAVICGRKNPGADPACDLAAALCDRIIDAIVGDCVRIRDEYDTDIVALSGSCFINRTLLEGAVQKLRGLGFKTFVNIAVSPDNGCVALGQAYVAMQAYLAMQGK